MSSITTRYRGCLPSAIDTISQPESSDTVVSSAASSRCPSPTSPIRSPAALSLRQKEAILAIMRQVESPRPQCVINTVKARHSGLFSNVPDQVIRRYIDVEKQRFVRGDVQEVSETLKSQFVEALKVSIQENQGKIFAKHVQRVFEQLHSQKLTQAQYRQLISEWRYQQTGDSRVRTKVANNERYLQEDASPYDVQWGPTQSSLDYDATMRDLTGI